MPAGPTTSSTSLVSSSWTAKMARLLLIPDNEEGLIAPALVLKATDYWPRIFLHAIWRELQAGDNQGRRLLRVTYAGLDLVYMYEYPAGERQVTQEDFTLELRLKQLLDTLGVRRFRMPPYACTSFVVSLKRQRMDARSSLHGQIGHIMHAYMVNSKGLRKRSSWVSSRFKLKIDPQNSSITTFTFCSVDTPYRQPPSGFMLTSRLLQEGRPIIEPMACDPLLNTANTYAETGDRYIPEIAQDHLSPISRNPFIPKTAPANSGRSSSTTLPSLTRSPHEEDVFTESKPHDHAKKQPYRSGDLTSNTAAVQRSAGIHSLPTPPTLSASDSSGSSISSLATPASPSPAPRHIRRAQGRLSLQMPTPTPTPSVAEPKRRARMSLMFPIPTPGSASGTESSLSRAAYRKSLDLSELARCRLWDAKGERENVRVRDKENMQ